MDKVTLTAEEFLTLYTGFIFDTSFHNLYDCVTKLYMGRKPYTISSIACAEKFRLHILETRPDLAKAVENIGGRFHKSKEKGTIEEQLKAYVNNFKTEIGTDKIEVDAMTYPTLDIDIENGL